MSVQIDQPRPQLIAWAFGAAEEEEAFPNNFRELPNKSLCVLHFRKHALCFCRRDRKIRENLQQEWMKYSETVRCTGPVMTELFSVDSRPLTFGAFVARELHLFECNCMCCADFTPMKCSRPMPRDWTIIY